MSFANPQESGDIVVGEIPRRKLISQGVAEQKFRRAVLEVAAQISADFSEHYWKEIINGEEPGQRLPSAEDRHLLRQRFLSYLNTTGKFLSIRDHLASAVARLIHQKSVKARPKGFHNHREFQNFLNDMYVFLTDDVRETLHRTQLQEKDPLDPPIPPASCPPQGEEEGVPALEFQPMKAKELEFQNVLRDLLFYSEELFFQGDYDNCHRLHLERICRSGEDPNCWFDFALMWILRGEDRMAEVAFRETLLKDPEYLYAMLVGGIIAVQHNDPRGILALSAALELKPISPELLVIMAFAHAAFGQKKDSLYFFRKAAYLQRTLTGQDKEGLEAVLNMLAANMVIEEKPPIPELFGMDAEYGQDNMENEEEEEDLGYNEEEDAYFDPEPEAVETEQLEKPVEEILPPVVSPNEDEQSVRNDSPNSKGSKGSKDKDQKLENAEEEEEENEEEEESPENAEDPSTPKTKTPSPVTTPDKEPSKVEDFYTRRNSFSRKSQAASRMSLAAPKFPKFDAGIDISQLVVEDSILPPTGTSLIVPWDITENSEKLSNLSEVDVNDILGGHQKQPSTKPAVEEPVVEEVVPPGPPTKDASKTETAGKGKKGKGKKGKDSEEKVEEKKEKPKGKKTLEKLEVPGEGEKRASGASEKGGKNARKSKNKGKDPSESDLDEKASKSGKKKGKRKQSNAPLQSQTEVQEAPSKYDHEAFQAKVASGEILNKPAFKNKPQGGGVRQGEEAGEFDEGEENASFDSKPCYVNRLGSELIWTAQLLLKLRMFDMLDGVLTRELMATGKRTFQFLYLRGMSLYLRRCQEEAIQCFEEALQLDPETPLLWMYRGHCYFELQDVANAMQSYEITLRLPVQNENRHMLYLRYGSLLVENGNIEMAKRIFLYGIQKHPTPYLWMAVGTLCYTEEAYEESEAAFSEANRLDHTNPNTWAYLSMVNLALGRQVLAEQTYKWAIRFGLKKGPVMDEVKRLQNTKGFGDPSVRKIPACIPYDYYVRRMGRTRPFDVYREALNRDAPNLGKKRFDNTAEENALIEKLGEATEE